MISKPKKKKAVKRLHVYFYIICFTLKEKFAFPLMFQDLHKLELRVLQKHAKEIEKQEKEKRLAKLREKVTFCFF